MKSERTWTISELAREFKVTPRALRFYEDRGLLSPRRDGLNRVYSLRDRGRLILILRGKRVGLVLCGGNIDPLLLAAIIERGMVRAGRLARIRVSARDVPGRRRAMKGGSSPAPPPAPLR